MTIGEKISKRRKELGMSADDLGRLTGRSRATVYRMENGDTRSFTEGGLDAVANALRVPRSYLLDDTVEEVPLSQDDARRDYLFEKYGALMSDVDGLPEAQQKEIEDFIKFKMLSKE